VQMYHHGIFTPWLYNGQRFSLSSQQGCHQNRLSYFYHSTHPLELIYLVPVRYRHMGPYVDSANTPMSLDVWQSSHATLGPV